MHTKSSRSDSIYYLTINTVLGLLMLVVLLPLVYMVMSSFSSPHAVNAGKVFLWPVEPTLEGYKAVFKHNLIGSAYVNTFIYTVSGTMLNLFMTFIAAYPLSQKNLPFRDFFMFLFTFTMLFSGGIIPNYLLINQLGMNNTRLAMILPSAISVYNMIIARTFIQQIPTSIQEASTIDGCTDFQFFIRMVLPLSKAVIAVLALYYAVDHWNAYFDAFLYLSNRKLYPLQIVLREILIANSMNVSEIMDDESLAAMQGMKDLVKFSIIIVSSVPILVIYPFVKKHFMQGVMLGAIKG